MITYSPLWETLKKKNITIYKLIVEYGVSRGTIDNLKHDRGVTTHTIDTLCKLLDCDICDIMKYTKE